MRTFPRSLATFREIVNQRGERLRKLPFEDLEKLTAEPTEHIAVESRPSTISIIVQTKPDHSLRVVVQGFMKARFVPFVKHVALDGFYKHLGGTVTPMPDMEFYEFD
jgi:hypothetical protein